MAISRDSDRPPEEENIPSHNPPWPFVNTFTQGRVERRAMDEGVTIDFDRLPKMQWWSRLFGVGENFRVRNVIVKLELHSHLARRRLTQSETDALAQYAAYTARSYSWIPLSALAIGAAATFKGRNTFKFPFYKPKMIRFNPNVFPSSSRPIAHGIQAMRLWHILRFTTYSSLLMLPASLFFSSYADTRLQLYVMRDNRLKRLVEEIRRNALEDMKRKNPGSHPSEPHSDSEHANDSAYQSSMTQEYGGAASGNAPESWPSSASVKPPPPQTQGYAQTSSTGHDDDDDSDLFDDDDASPVSPAARRAAAAAAAEQSSRSRGSSWEEVRRQAMSGNSAWAKGDSSGQEEGWAQLRQDKTRTPREAKPKTDEYTYSKEDEEKEARNYEKEKAQAEFDALLEAERRGEKPAGTTGGWRRRS